MKLPLIPIRDVVVFPQTMFPFIIGRESSVKALEYALRNERYLFLATQKDPATDEPQAGDIFTVGTMALIIQNLKLPDGNIKVLVEGLQRGRIVATTHDPGFFMVEAELLEPEQVSPDRAESIREQLLEAFGEYVKINPSFNADAMSRVIKGPDLNKVADTISGNIPIGIKEKQELLEIDHPEERFAKIIELIRFEIEKLKLDKSIQGRVREQMEKAQKEYYLHEKIRAIQKELGEDQQTSEIDELKEKVAKAGMTEDAEAKVLKEIRRLEAMPSMSAESTVSRNYVDWLLSLPWDKKSREIRDIGKAEKILEADHYGLEKIKERILEYLAVRQMSRKSQGSILCFVGPPGVGKTSLGRSIARATGRQFVRLSLGGVRDEAEIRGHRRTYIGAFPGQIIQMMKKAGTQNPVFVLDEVDKMSVDFRGDPSAALLEVLDPEQNSHFLDHFIDTEYDLSRVMFICTANVLHAIPRPLQDRMEILEISGYTEREKLEIAKRFLVRKQREASGLSERQIVFTDEALLGIIRHYTRESGVRNLEREIGRVCRKVVREILSKGRSLRVAVDPPLLEKLLGPIRFRLQKSQEKSEVGVATGMAWTDMGGEILLTEVTRMPGTGKLTLTGKIGEVMQESAHAALSYVRSRAETFHINPEFYKNEDIHVHIPEGAIPKDGPSAGITMATAIVSSLTGIPVRRDVALTGEITLRGQVLPIGGVKEKILAAHRAGIKLVALPTDNRKDIQEIPEEVRDELEVHFVETMDEVLGLALERLPGPLQTLDKKAPAAIDGEVKEGHIAN
ncbi:MAG TPA: endopeptidase La [Acidobacteriota bacterium]|nr:endopeptidase La [Acidobacteriota bacterium]